MEIGWRSGGDSNPSFGCLHFCVLAKWREGLSPRKSAVKAAVGRTVSYLHIYALRFLLRSFLPARKIKRQCSRYLFEKTSCV